MFFLRARKLLKCFASPLYFKALFVYHVLPAVEHEHLFRRKTWGTIFDIGANRGQFSVVSVFGSDAKIVAFEPLVAPAKQFRRLLGSERRVELHQCALGAASGQAMMNVSARDDSSSLLPITNTQVSLYANTQCVGAERVVVECLSSFFSAETRGPVLLKIDVQGYEYDVLNASSDVLQRVSAIYCECSFIELYEGQRLASEVISLLRDNGFALAGVYNCSYDRQGRAVQADLYFDKTAHQSL